MKYIGVFFLLVITTFFSSNTLAQTADSTQTPTVYSGSIGFTNNGFSIIPTFSLNSPAAIVNLSWRKKRFSFEPDIRLVPDATKGGVLLWLRYRLIDNKKFSLRVGAHPAFTLIRRPETVNGTTQHITELLRFAAIEVVPNYQVTKNWSVGAMYLEGHGLQKHGPQTTRVLFLNTGITNIGLGKNLLVNFFPSVFFLYTDGYRGDYLTVTGVLAHKKLPFTLQSTINQTLTSNLPANQDFMWNVGVFYNFRRTYTPLNQ